MTRVRDKFKTDSELIKGETDVEKLMEKLKDVSNRKERRRLITAFTKKQAAKWGSGAAFGTMNDSENSLRLYEDLANNPNLAWNDQRFVFFHH